MRVSCLALATVACGSTPQRAESVPTIPSDSTGLVLCPDKVKAADRLAPELHITEAGDRAFAIGLRSNALQDACSHDGWTSPANRCLRDATNADQLAHCVTQLAPTNAQVLATNLATADRLLRATFATRDRGVAIDCDAIVETYYGDRAWSGKSPQVIGGDRTAMIGRSRDLMLQACRTADWSPQLRSCLVSGGHGECFAAAGFETTGWRSRWVYPPLGVIVPTGVPECDAFETTVEAEPCLVDIGICVIHHNEAIEEAARLTANAADNRGATAQECKLLDEAVRASQAEPSITPR